MGPKDKKPTYLSDIPDDEEEFLDDDRYIDLLIEAHEAELGIDDPIDSEEEAILKQYGY